MQKKRAASKRLNKAAFVRSLPATMPAKEIVAKAKSDGFTLSEAYVYNIRTTSRTGGRSVKGATATRAPRAAASGSTEELLRAVAAELGLTRAISILQGEQQRVRRLLGA